MFTTYNNTESTATQFPHFGPGEHSIVLSNITCNGNEANLTQCRYNGSGANNCQPSRAAGVFCSAGKPVQQTILRHITA